MRHLKIAMAVALGIGGLSSLANTANATILATGVDAAADRLNLVDEVQFTYGGHRHCWYEDGWHGPGWYWCGYRMRRGAGWAGGEGFRGWRHR